MSPFPRWSLRALVPLWMFLACVLGSGGCQCVFGEPPPDPPGLVACRTQRAHSPATSRPAPEVETVAAGTIPGTFSITSTGESVYAMDLATPPSRAGMGPGLQIVYRSDGGDGVLGNGFSLTGLSAITPCPKSLAQDGEIRGVRYGGDDALCLDGQRLVPVGEGPGTIEYRTFPDTFVKVVGHYPPERGAPAEALFFEAYLPTGRMVEYGRTEGSKPLARGGVPRAWLANEARDGRGNAMTYAYCLAEAEDGHAAEYAVDEIRYTSFEGTPSLEPSRAVRFVYGTKDAAAVRTGYSGGVALQRSLRLEEIQMLGPGDALVRSYGFRYELSPTTSRTLLTQVEECASDGVCKPPTRLQYSRGKPGFERLTTDIDKPVSEKASPMVFDIDADGLDDLVIPDIVAGPSTPSHPITAWGVARNLGPRASPSFLAAPELAFLEDWLFVADPDGPSDPALLQPELGTVLDYNDDGQMDVFLHDVFDTKTTWHVLLSQPNRTFALHDTGIRRPFPLGVTPAPPSLRRAGASVHLADLDGDSVPDLIQCQDHAEELVPDPLSAVWTVHLWRPARGTTPAGFDPTGESIELLTGYPCAMELHTLDIDADSKIDLIVPSVRLFDDGTALIKDSYEAIMRRGEGRWGVIDTKLPVVPREGRVVFLDVNGDGLPDAVESGFSGQLYTYLNTGSTFVISPFRTVDAFSFGDLLGVQDQDALFRLAVPLDFNGDGRQDLLMPVPPGMLLSGSNVLPSWAVLQATGDLEGPPFKLVDAGVPFEAKLGDAITLADPHGPRTGDLNGDGAQDVILPLGGVFNVFQNLSADQDLLVAVSDGMNAHEPTEPGFVPNVSISYGHLTDAPVTSGGAEEDPNRRSALYVARSGAADDCGYPRRCVVGPRRVVSAYALNNGADRARRFEVGYRDGRYHRLGRGFLGFGERIVTDLDTGAVTIDVYDHVTFDDGLQVFPFAGSVQRTWHGAPGLASQPRPEQIELSFSDVTRTLVPTNDGATYFTLPTDRRVRRAQGVYPPPGGAVPSVEAYVREIGRGGDGATLLRDSASKVTDFDTFGNVRAEEVSTEGVDLTLKVTRSFKNDTERWVLGQLETQKECSAAAGMSQCRTLTRTTTIYGEVETESTESDDGLPDTKLKLTYARDDFGNITSVTAEDAFGHKRTSSTDFDEEGMFPEKYVNAAGHATLVDFDDALGVLLKQVDPNQLVTTWAHDGFGRLGIETRPDGTTTTVTLSRTEDGGPAQDAWRVRQQRITTGGADDTVEFDSFGRPIRWLGYGPEPEPSEGSGGAKRIMQEIGYDALGENIARRSVPVREDTPESAILYDRYEYDAVGREVRHTTPWNAVTTTEYDGLRVRVTDPLDHVTVTEQDPLGRIKTVTDAADGITRYAYGPFGLLHTVTDPGEALTRTTLDAFGRVRQLDDPDRGTTVSIHDGFGELISSTDALERKVTWTYDALGRPRSRVDQDGAESLTTTWTWDTAAHGVGKLHTLASPDGEKAYGYTGRGQLDTIALRLDGERSPLEARLGYDELGRVQTVTYPAPAGAAPFVVAHDRDAHGHVLAVRDSGTNLAYWRLTDVDDAGRFREEVFGNGAVTERSYFADKQRLRHMATQSRAGEVQDLDYGFDDLLNLTRRTDALQPENTTERFRYDSLHRLTCAYFSDLESASAPCALRYGYHPNGNLSFKSDVGDLSYDDPLHPHAITGAGTDSYAHDAVGNQTARPGGTTVRYRAFDLPERITQGASTITFGYDGDQQRIRKITPEKETLYFGDLYERVTDAASGAVEHRFHVHSPERVVAIVTRGGSDDGTRYVHVDHLGSIDALTDEDGGLIERRSYDPFGQRRNPVWGERPPASFPSETTQGFTGHESDDDLGLVNMKGRIYDPRIGRFLTTDPIISIPSFGQSWNPYSYVRNSPLNHVDPSGFQEEPVEAPILPVSSVVHPEQYAVELFYSRPKANQPEEGPREAVEVGATTAPIDVGTTGSSSGYVPQPVTVSPEHSGVGGPGTVVGQTLLGAAEGTRDLGAGIARMLVLNALTLGMYSGYEFASAMWHGYDEAGPVGALNAVNPLYHIGRGAADTALAIDRDDYRTAGAAGTKAMVIAAATVFGMGRGLGAAEEAAAAGAATATPRAYSVVFETTIPKAGVGRYPAHFAAANENLLQAMADPQLAQMLRQTLGQQFESTVLSPTGRVLGRSPTGWTWHHVPGRPGVLQLVPIEQHASGSSWQNLLHPNGQGGMSEWGHLY
ncbi:RHS repeat-associated core domain-containing protein [Sorangium atrum]|uniref:FG-GAP-like repeat-containing protein n=1 Tax=Sorangium atrum TaxID=2995308 RepID=A0ABT5CBC5_9BACT|nr:RHS repeat-associated core domain-containing protein [Sorangium aterium]MDC0682432.1 FG-GAP-like repeat-containing protein [Sorangium aterium]